MPYEVMIAVSKNGNRVVMVVDGKVVSTTLQEDEILVPLENFNDFLKPKWDGAQWIEGKVFTLDELKVQKHQEVTNAYQTELNGTFSSIATGTSLVYDFSLTSQELWKELASSIDAGRIPEAVFPMNITLANGIAVPHEKAQLQQIFGEITMRKLFLYGKWQTLVTDTIPNATEETISTIAW